MNAPKYALEEIERRWLVDLAAAGPLAQFPCREIDDRYLTGTRLRLRCMRDGTQVVHKLCKKYGKAPGGVEPITNLYLTQAEYETLAQLPALAVRKHRYAIADGRSTSTCRPKGWRSSRRSLARRPRPRPTSRPRSLGPRSPTRRATAARRWRAQHCPQWLHSRACTSQLANDLPHGRIVALVVRPGRVEAFVE